MSKYATVERQWPGATIVCIGAGPSLIVEDVEYVRNWREQSLQHGFEARVIVINKSYELALWADVMYACDKRFWEWEKGAPRFIGLKFALTLAAKRWPDVKVLDNAGVEGISDDPSSLKNGANSGYQAMNLALHFGAAKIVLLGYDMKVGRHEAEHWHGDHPNKSRSPYQKFQRMFNRVAPLYAKRGVRVINASRVTALKCFERLPLDQALAVEGPAAVLPEVEEVA